MKFKRYGKAYQLLIRSSQDLPHVLNLDDSHWAVTSAPITAFKCDKQLLAFLDNDNNGRVRTDEIRSAISWCLNTLSDTSGMDAGMNVIKTSAIRKDSADGAALLTTAAYVSEQTQSPPEEVSLEHVRQCMDELRMKPLNGDGVIVPEAAPDAEVADYITAAIEATEGDMDLSGKTGIGAEKLAAFESAIGDFLDWKDEGDNAGEEVMPFGADTHAVWERTQHHAPQIERFFMLAGFRNFDPENANKFLAAKTAAEDPDDALNYAPLAIPDAESRLPLIGPAVNPAYTDDVAEIRNDIFAKVLGTAPEAVTAEDWNRVKKTLAPYGAYLAAKQGGIVEHLPLEKLRAWYENPHTDIVAQLIEADKDVTRRVAAFNDLEKLILFHGNLLRFINNFVCLSEFYSPKIRALFERGSAVIDGRWFNFSIEAADPSAHSAVAKTSELFILYLKVEHRTDPEKSYTVAVPATAGTRGNLVAGKRGIFFDVYGAEHDCVITQIIENPISLVEAVLAPFIKIGTLIIGKIEALSTSAEEAIVKSADLATTAPPAGAPPAANAASPATLLMSISISIAALGSGLAVLFKSFGAMTMRGRLYSAVIGALIILVPFTIGGIIKLARQDLSAILEGCGWAVNQRLRLTGKLRRQFTERRAYPEGAEGTPRKERRSLMLLLLLIAVILAALAWEWRFFSQ